ncbi:MAG: hypothetical protein RBT76_01495 [candidate division Zixibacteria bacterium]|jgi:hypothetical protein|nr:hypothetical protein [candidate division Zixibacteria bacterium]
MSGESRIEPRAVWPFVVISALLVALRYGFNYGIGNHNTYLLHALRLVDPSVLTHDWLATIDADYHPAFTRLAALLMGLDGSGWMIGLANVVCIGVGVAVIFLIVRAVTGRRNAVMTFLPVAMLTAVGSTYSVSGSYIFSITFQPSTLAGVGYLGAIAAFICKRYLLSGVCAATAGLFHANFLVLTFPAFGLAHLFAGRRQLVRRLLVQLVPSLIPLALLTPLLLGQTESPNAAYARYVFQHVQAPQHYVPMTFLTEFITFGAWCGLGVLGGWRVMRESEPGRLLGAVGLSFLLLIAIASLLTTIVFIPVASQLYVWRLAPYVVLICQIFAAAGLVRQLLEDDFPLIFSRRIALFAVAALLIGLTFRYHYGEFRMTQVWVLGTLATAFLFVPQLIPPCTRRRIFLGVALIIGVWLTGLLIPASEVVSRSSLVTGLPADEQELYDWAAQTPDTSVFLIPPRLENFRFNARRAVVVDAKSTPVDPDQVVEWYHRLRIVAGIDTVSGPEEAAAGYRALDSARCAAIDSIFPHEYVVLSEVQGFVPGADLRSAFANRSYRVYERVLR